LILKASDPDGDWIWFFSPDLPDGSTLNAASGEFEWMPGFGQSGDYEVTFIVADLVDSALADTLEAMIAVLGANRPPIIENLADTTIVAGQYLTFVIGASDPDSDNICFTSPDLPGGAILNGLTGLFEWHPTHDQVGDYTLTLIATDMSSEGLSSSAQMRITVTEAMWTGGSAETDQPRPHEPHLAQNYPNPFGGTTLIEYSLPTREEVTLTIYDMNGALVRELVSRTMPPGIHQAVWDGRDERGREVRSAVYFYRLDAGTITETKRMTLLR
jgi:hypothetical protein